MLAMTSVNSTPPHYDVAVVGGGPAGISAALYTAQKGLKTCVFERRVIGGTVCDGIYVENIPGLVTPLGNIEYSDNCRNQLEKAGITILELVEVVDIRINPYPFLITTPVFQKGAIVKKSFCTASAVILATGVMRRELAMPGAQELYAKGVSNSSTCDGPLYRNKRVAVIGGGNSAMTDILYLLDFIRHIYLIHRQDRLSADLHFQTEVLDHPQVEILRNTEVTQIHGDEIVGVRKVSIRNTLTNEEDSLRVSAVFGAIGTIPQIDLAEKMGVELTPERFIKVDSQQRTNIPRVYAAGDTTSGSGHILVTMGEGVRAAMSTHHDLVNL